MISPIVLQAIVDQLVYTVNTHGVGISAEEMKNQPGTIVISLTDSPHTQLTLKPHFRD